MRVLSIMLVIMVALAGCATTKLVQIKMNDKTQTSISESQGDSSNSDEITRAVNKREYISLYNAIYQTAIPKSIMSKVSMTDKIKIIMTERNDNYYKDYYHIFVSALANSLISKGYSVISLPAADLNSNTVADKYLFVTVYEAGIQYGDASGTDLSLVAIQNKDYEAGKQYGVAKSGKTRYAAFRIMLELANPQSSLILASETLSSVYSEKLTKDEVDSIARIKLKSTNADMPLTLGGNTTLKELTGAANDSLKSDRTSVVFTFQLGDKATEARIVRDDGTIVHKFPIPSFSQRNSKVNSNVENTTFTYEWMIGDLMNLKQFTPIYRLELCNIQGAVIGSRDFSLF